MVFDLETPFASVDLDAVDRNIARMQSYCDEHGLACRPHVKTHKMPGIAWRQLAAGAVGITCQKLTEAAVMVAAGIDDVLLTYPIVGPAKLERLCGLARVARITVAADSAEVARGLSGALSDRGLELDFLAECDTGLGRTGVRTATEARELGLLVDALPGLRFAGLMTYPSTPRSQAILVDARDAIEDAGLQVECVSGGGTENAFHTHELSAVTELRPGTYVYGDRACIANGTVPAPDCALRIHATVVSRPTPTYAILDAGSKVMTADPVEAPGVRGYGTLPALPGAIIDLLHEEHARLILDGRDPPMGIGDRVEIIPNHACGATNMQDTVLVHRSGEPVGVWPVAARGTVK